MTRETQVSRSRKWKWGIALLSIVIALVAAELLLRWALFDTPMEIAAKDPSLYARNQDELWIYRHLFSNNKRWDVAPGRADTNNDTRIEFYKAWPTSLMPDAELGYVRKPDVRAACHETTHLGTRGTRDSANDGPKILFFGDSFVESAACSNDTLTTQVERLTGIDTLNYGVGGYGLDQMLLYFRRVVPRFDRDDSLVLVGLIQDDLDRVLLKVRTSPKPYFTIRDDTLELHTDHIHADALNDYFQRPSERSYLYDLVRGRLGTPTYRAWLRETRDARHEAVNATSRLLFESFVERRREGRFALAFVIFPTPGAPFDDAALAMLRAQAIHVVDLQGCLRDSGRPDTDLFAELHPTSLGNALLAQCLVADLKTQGLLK